MNPRGISKQDIKNVVTLGAGYLLDGTVEQKEWSSRIVEQSGPLIEQLAVLAGISQDDILIGVWHHAEKISTLLRGGNLLAAGSWIEDYATKLTRNIEQRGGIVLDDDDGPDGWKELCKHPAVHQPVGAKLGWIIYGLSASAFLYLLFTTPRILIDTRYGLFIGVLGMFTLALGGLVLYAVIAKKLQKRRRKNQQRVN